MKPGFHPVNLRVQNAEIGHDRRKLTQAFLNSVVVGSVCESLRIESRMDGQRRAPTKASNQIFFFHFLTCESRIFLGDFLFYIFFTARITAAGKHEMKVNPPCIGCDQGKLSIQYEYVGHPVTSAYDFCDSAHPTASARLWLDYRFGFSWFHSLFTIVCSQASGPSSAAAWPEICCYDRMFRRYSTPWYTVWAWKL